MTKNPAMTKPTPEQQDCNALAAFIEVAEELQREPFFSAADKSSAPNTGTNGGTGLGNRFHFRSALLGFHRLGSERDPASFAAASKLLKCFEEGGPPLDTLRLQQKGLTERRWAGLPHPAGGVVDLWLSIV